MFVKFYNCFMEAGQYKLTPKQWYFYALLQMRLSYFLNRTETNIDILVGQQNVFNHSRPSKNKESIKNVIDELERLGVINIVTKESPDKSQYSNTIYITFSELGNFEKITPDIFENVRTPNELYALCVIKRFNQWGFCKKLDEWKIILDCSYNTAMNVLHDLRERGLITNERRDIRRDADGNFTSDPNTYYLSVLKQEETVVNEEINDINDLTSNVVDISETRPNNWDDYKLKLTIDDFIVLLTTEDKDLIKRANRRIDRVSAKSDGGKTAMRKLREGAQSIIDKEESKIREDEQKKSDVALMNKFKPLIEQTNSMYVLFDDGTHKQYQDYQWDVKPYMFVSKYIDEYSNLGITCVKWENLFSGKNDVEDMYEEHLEAIKWEREHHVV